MDEFVVRHLVWDADKQPLEFTPLQKELIFKEINYRIKDNLNTISSLFGLQQLQAQAQKNISVSKILQSNKLRINVFSLLQELTYAKQITLKSFERYLVLLLDMIEEELGERVDRVLSVELTQLETSQMILLGTIVAELYINTLRHAVQDEGFEGVVKISLTQKGHQTIFDYLEAGHSDVVLEKLSHNETIGLKLVKLHVQQLRGKLLIDMVGGLHFRIVF